MAKRIFLFLIIGLSVVGCKMWGVRGSGHVETEIRNVADFKSIEIAGNFVVDIEIEDAYYLEVKADDNLMDYITTRVRGENLIIDTKKNLNPRKDIKIKIKTPHLEMIESSGANEIWASGINEDYLEIILSGAGSIDLRGDVEKLQIGLSGAGNVNARKLYAKNTRISISGAASADVYASESIDAEVSGVGSIDFYGDPADVRTDISGVGSINRK